MDRMEADDDAPTPPEIPTLATPTHPDPLERRNVMAQMKLHAKRRYVTTWKAQQDQGRTVASHGGVGSAFLTRGNGLTDRDYRFAVAARLNQLPTRAVLKRRRQSTVTRCRVQGCPQQAETLGHIVNHCAANNPSIRARHDRVLDSIAAELRQVKRKGHVEVRVNRSLAQDPNSAQRPDLQLIDHDRKRVVLADLVVAFDADTAGHQATGLDAAHTTKLVKYTPMMRALQQRGWSTTLTAIANGSMGSVRRSN
ncbi:Reverse transcriptase (RNA-dependent DNA polymerase) subfamily [Phytophthora palmivora]|uniref:Reverse transcriptase (RNA-dependent DNA polymerase) subfamily n=1 Tax=Phytophthora palmivora TaxID=4796 RepID=A0A2P4Y119_9STRA|nr:Reverse transcriptase (RNA-dependent DNA polymerase) subfamily [Phytophthora palmivora]